MIDMRNIPEEPPKISKGVRKAVSQFLTLTKPVDVGRFGISINIGSKEIFLGVCLTRIEVETIVKQKQKRVKIQTKGVRIIDL